MTTPEARKRRETWILRLEIVAIAIVLTAIGGQYIINANLQTQSDKLAESQRQGRLNSRNACQQSNKKLRAIINERIVAPLRATLSSQGQPETAGLFRTVPYANCAHLYPLDGEPQPPFYREVPVPPLLHSSLAASSPNSALQPGAVVSPSPEDKRPQAPEHPGGSDGITGTAPAAPSAPSVPTPPPPASFPAQCPFLSDLLHLLNLC